MNKELKDQARCEESVIEVLAQQQTPPVSLLPKIMAVIARRQRFHARLKVSSFSVLSFVSLGVIFLAISDLIKQISQLGTLRIFSLIFSDLSVVLAHWSDFSFSLLEALPVWPIVSVLVGTLLLLISIKYLVESLLFAGRPFNGLKLINN